MPINLQTKLTSCILHPLALIANLDCYHAMSTITFDTLKFSQRLEKAGATREYAIAEAEALSDVFETGTQELATKNDVLMVKNDVLQVKNELKAEMREMELRLNSDMKLMRWMLGLSLALSTGIIALLAKLFISLPHS